MNENPDCLDCALGHRVIHSCMPSIGDQDCRLAIYLDTPAAIEDRRGRSFVGDNAEFVKYCLRRMSVNLDDVYLDYVVKCAAGKLPGKADDRMACVRACSQYRYAALKTLMHLKAMVVLGSLGCEMVTLNKNVGQHQGSEWIPASPTMKKYFKHIWVGFSPGLVKEKPAESGSIYRVIFMAAQEAGLKPKANLTIKPYEFPHMV